MSATDFDYFVTHDFHKLVNNIQHKEKLFSLFHTNICSLQATFDEFFRTLESLEHQFDVIALSETWISKAKVKKINTGHLTGYQKYIGTCGTSTKVGCGFYVREDIKVLRRKDLDISFNDELDEFQFKWIALVNNKKINIVVGVAYRHPKKHLHINSLIN